MHQVKERSSPGLLARTIGINLAWLLKNTAELQPNGRDARVFRSEVFRDGDYIGSVNFAVSGRILRTLKLWEVESNELKNRVIRSYKAHAGWLIQSRKLPRADDFVFEIRAIAGTRSADELIVRMDPEGLQSLNEVSLSQFSGASPIGGSSVDTLEVKGLFGFGESQSLHLSSRLTVVIGENGSGKSSLRKILHELSKLALGARPFDSELRWAHDGGLSPNAEVEPRSTIVLRCGSIRYEAVVRQAVTGQAGFEHEELVDSDHVLFKRPDSSGFDCSYEQRIADNIDSQASAQIAGPCDPNRSLLSQLTSVWLHPSPAALHQYLAAVRTYSAWEFSDAQTVARTAADISEDFLYRDGSNLKSVLASLSAKGDNTFDMWFECVMRNEPKLLAQGSTLRYLHSGREFAVTELSDGSLRWAQVLAAVLSEATMIVLDEPELGLHPDLIGSLASFLKEQALRVQIVVFTHSKDLLSALDTMHQDADETLHVQVLEQEAEGNTIQTPNLAKLREEYPAEEITLGDLWARGLIGGNRW
jgi:predicted ATPase